MVYSQEVSLDVSKSQILSVLGDPFSFTGIVGHINILQVFDKEQARYVTPESLREPVNDFLVLYVFGTPDTKLSIMKGYMDGPKPIPVESVTLEERMTTRWNGKWSFTLQRETIPLDLDPQLSSRIRVVL
jgi:hypothetical protein